MSEPLDRMLNEVTVLDTDTPILYIGKLVEYTDRVFVLVEAEMHDCRDGHANKEVYLAGARLNGVPINRREVIVMRSAVISVSRLADIVID
jgi:hypothetical protein